MRVLLVIAVWTVIAVAVGLILGRVIKACSRGDRH